MSFTIPQSTAYVVMFKAFLATDHVSEATGKTIVITISKNGGAFGSPNAGATNATEVSSGWYKFTLDTTDTNTLGPIAVRGAVATIDDVGLLYDVRAAYATASAVAAIDTAVADIPTNAELATALGTSDDAVLAAVADLPTNAELTAALDTADDAMIAAIATVDTVVDAIKFKTDSLTFTVANKVDANILSVNSVTVDGTGAPGSEWGPA